jgi:hypothetical protein
MGIPALVAGVDGGLCTVLGATTSVADKADSAFRAGATAPERVAVQVPGRGDALPRPARARIGRGAELQRTSSSAADGVRGWRSDTNTPSTNAHHAHRRSPPSVTCPGEDRCVLLVIDPCNGGSQEVGRARVVLGGDLPQLSA